MLLIGLLGRHCGQLMALLPERLRVLTSGTTTTARMPLARCAAAFPGRALSRFAVVDECRMCLVLGVVEVNVRHHAGILRPGASNQLAGSCEEFVSDCGELAEPPPGCPVARLC